MVEAFIGRFGSGKTYSMVRQAAAMVQRPGFDRVVASNFQLKGDIWGDWVYVDSARELPGISKALVLLDEAAIWFDNRGWQDKERNHVWNWLTQSRKHYCHIWYTAQTEKGVDAKLVRNTATFWVHQRYALWGNWFRQQGYDPASGERFKGSWYRFNPAIGALYDTHEIVGLADGTKRGVGAASERLGGRTVACSEDARLVSACQGALVRLPGDSVAEYRPATPDDVLNGVELLRPAGRRSPWPGGLSYAG